MPVLCSARYKCRQLTRGLMLYRILFLLMLGLGTASPQATIPDSPVGKTFKAWLEAFNSGDRAQMEAYCQKFVPWQFPWSTSIISLYALSLLLFGHRGS